MRKSKKILIGLVSLVLAAILIWVIYYLVRFVFYNDYKKYISSYEVEEGTEFKPLSESISSVDGMILAAENETLKLYVNEETAEIAVYDKRNGQITYSNPMNPDEDSIANTANKNYMKSQLIITYFNTSRLESVFDTYTYSTSLGQFELEALEDGLRVKYTIGDLSSKTGIVPQYISQTALDNVLSKLDDEGKKYVNSKFIKSKVADDYMELLESAVTGASQIRKLNKYFTEAGFTQEEYNIEMEGSGVDGAVPISFMVPLEYRLNGDALDVSVPTSEIEEFGGGSIFRIQLLRYFGAAGMDETGYLLVPNGSGSIINFNNGKGTSIAGDDYSEYIYGIDPLAAEYTVRENTENCKLALFGIFRENSSIFATIEDGASLCNLTANVSGEVNELNYMYPSFVLRGNDKLSMFGTTGSEGELPIVEKNTFDCNITVKYTMMAGEDTGYSAVANYYRERLISEGVLTPNEENGDIKFYYNILGGVEKTKFFLGTQYRGLYAMTTFNEAADISDDLASRGISNQVMNYQGWFNGGYYHDVADKIRVPWKLGGKSDLEDLSATLTENGGTFYADVAFQKVTEVSSRYDWKNETSRYYGAGYVAEFGLVNPATLRQTSGLNYAENRFFLISPKFLVRYVSRFANKIEGYDISGISLRDLGNELHSDKKRTNVIDREASLDVVDAQLQRLEDTGKVLMLNDANDYAFQYATDIINVPLDDNDYYIVDQTVPFYEMLIHGCIDYSGYLINLNDTTDQNDVILELIEAGASPHFIFSHESSNNIKYTGLVMMYSTTYDNWKDYATEVYEGVNEALKHVSGAFMTDYKISESGVKVITYSNGVKIYINNSNTSLTADGVVVPAESYRLEGAQ